MKLYFDNFCLSGAYNCSALFFEKHICITMKYLSLDEIQKQCNVDPQWDGDDEFLVMVGDSAEDMAAQLLDCPLEELAAQNGELPATVRHAIRILTDYFYAVNRGSSDNDKEIPEAALIMLKLYRQFN